MHISAYTYPGTAHNSTCAYRPHILPHLISTHSMVTTQHITIIRRAAATGSQRKSYIYTYAYTYSYTYPHLNTSELNTTAKAATSKHQNDCRWAHGGQWHGATYDNWGTRVEHGLYTHQFTQFGQFHQILIYLSNFSLYRCG